MELSKEVEFPSFFELKQRQPSLIKSGSSEIDLMLGGGISPNQITEIYGESGSGKTQFAIQVALNFIKQRDFKQKVLFVTTKKQVNGDRLRQLSGSFTRLPLSGRSQRPFDA